MDNRIVSIDIVDGELIVTFQDGSTQSLGPVGEMDLEQLTAAVVKNAGDIVGLKRAVSALQTGVGAAETAIEGLQDDTDSLENEIDALKNDFDDLKSALDGIGIVGKNVEDVIISNSSKKWATYSNSKIVIYHVNPLDNVKIKTGNYATYYTVLTDDTVVVGELPNYATGFDGTVLVGSSAETTVTIPSDGNYIVIVLSSGSTVTTPEVVSVGYYNLFVNVPANFNNILEPIGTLNNTVGEIQGALYNTAILVKTVENVVISGTSKKWVAYNNSEFVFYPVSPNDEITISTGVNATYYTVLTDDTVVVGELPNYATGFDGSVSIGSSTTGKVRIPADGKYIVIFNKSGGTNVSPTSVINGTYDYTIDLMGNIIINGNSSAHTAKNQTHTFAKRQPMVTFIDDDGNVEFYQYLLPIMQEYGIPMVSAYMGDSNPDMESNSAMMNYAQCVEVAEAGGEFITHYSHDATTMTIENAEAMMLKSKNTLDKFGFGKASRILAYSNGTSNTDIRAMVSKHFDCAFSGAYPRVSDTDRSNHGCIVQYAIHREPAGGMYYDDSATCQTLQYFKDMIDECIASNGWLVFTLHSWLMPEGKRKPQYADTDQFGLLEGIIEYIQELQNGGSNIRIVTASEGLEAFGNAWQAGDYLGYWNQQTLTNTPTLGDHSQPGCAMNKLGQYDFPTGNNITPQGN